MNLSRRFLLPTLGLLFSCFIRQIPAAAADDQPVEVYSRAAVRVIPISVTGYSGEANSVVKFDLEVMGFQITDSATAQYNLAGKNDGSQVEGRLTDRLSKASLLAKAYTGGTTRSQAHTLADEVVQAILRVSGIARTKIAFKGESPDGRTSEIYISDYDGQNSIQVTRDNSLAAAPAWVPQHLHLLYTSYKSGFAWLYSHNLSTGERRPFAKFGGLNTSAAISPDGKRVAMILSKTGSPDVWVSNIDGTGLTQLTKTAVDESSPCWSPDGSKICFASKIDERRGLFLISSSGGPMSRLNVGGVPSPSEPDWSPDGKSIVFTSQRGGGFDICTVAPSGGNADLLVAGEDPSWAPNSRTVVFARRVGSKRVLSLLDVPTKRVKDTAQVAGSRSQPSWAK
jgi:TolB protein